MMEPLPELTNGLQVLEPFLSQHGFILENYQTGKGSGGKFTIATYKNGQKKFIIGYRASVGELSYHYYEYNVMHAFYLDHLGYAEIKQFPDFQSDNKLLAFEHILHDFKYLIDDFFAGACKHLIEASILQDKLAKEQNVEWQQEFKYHYERKDIEKARQKFKEKEYKKCLEIYMGIKYRILLTDFDKKVIDYSERHK